MNDFLSVHKGVPLQTEKYKLGQLVRVSEDLKMRKYKVYVRLNKEVFEISEDDEVVYRYEQDSGYALCDFINIDINKLWPEIDNEKNLLDCSQVFLFAPCKAEFEYIKNLYDVIKGFISESNKSVNYTFKRQLCVSIENIDGEICRVIYPTSVSDILLFLFYEIIEKNMIFRKCKRCERMFPVYYHRNIQFCERIDKRLNKSCRQIKFKYLNDVYDESNDDVRQIILDIFERAYKRQRGRVDYGSLNKTKFKNWSKKARKQRDLCLNGKITIQEFEKWIIDNDRNYDEED